MCAGPPTSAMPKRMFCVHQPLAVPSGGGVLVVAGCVSVLCWWWWCDMLPCHVVWCHVFRSEVTWGRAMWLVARWHVVMWCLSCNVMWCDMMWCHVMWCDVMWWMRWCNGMRCSLKWCDVMWLCDVLNWEEVCCELRRAHVTAKPLRGPFQCVVRPWDAKQRKTTESPCRSTTTPYYKVLLAFCIEQYNISRSGYHSKFHHILRLQ